MEKERRRAVCYMVAVSCVYLVVYSGGVLGNRIGDVLVVTIMVGGCHVDIVDLSHTPNQGSPLLSLASCHCTLSLPP